MNRQWRYLPTLHDRSRSDENLGLQVVLLRRILSFCVYYVVTNDFVSRRIEDIVWLKTNKAITVDHLVMQIFSYSWIRRIVVHLTLGHFWTLLAFPSTSCIQSRFVRRVGTWSDPTWPDLIRLNPTWRDLTLRIDQSRIVNASRLTWSDMTRRTDGRTDIGAGGGECGNGPACARAALCAHQGALHRTYVVVRRSFVVVRLIDASSRVFCGFFFCVCFSRKQKLFHLSKTVFEACLFRALFSFVTSTHNNVVFVLFGGKISATANSVAHETIT